MGSLQFLDKIAVTNCRAEKIVPIVIFSLTILPPSYSSLTIVLVKIVLIIAILYHKNLPSKNNAHCGERIDQ